ncbi:MAG TPA: efflux RND transporter periplasmic adaptor subunit [Thermoanaerobaculia bacterium]|nr:efflux RND transporter periplasmic adaptor subunit [Thermoanaerobaculia bacterium]
MIHNSSSMDRPAAAQRNPRIIIAAVAGVVLLIVAAVVFPAVRRWFVAEKSVDAKTIRLATVSRGDLLRDISVQARVVASLSPTLFSPGQGIVSLRTRAGSQVKQGEVLATIDSKELQAALDQAQSQLLTSRAELDRQKIVARQAQLRAQQQVELLTLRVAAAKRQLERVSTTFKEGLSNKADFETAQDNVRIAEMELGQAKGELGLSRETLGFEVATREQQVLRQQSVAGELEKRVTDLTIRAPFDGMVASVAVQDRDAVAPNQAILAVVNLSSLELEIGLPEEYANETAIGTPAQITFLGREYPGRVTAISPEVVNSQLVATVAFEGEQPQGLRQNQRLTTRLTFESKQNVLKVARGPFLEAEGGRAAYVVDGKSVTRRDIVVGASSIGEVEIVNGLKEGETIVVSDTSAFEDAKNVMLR